MPVQIKNRKAFLKSFPVFSGAPSGTRTLDPLIKSQLLYQLSQWRVVRHDQHSMRPE